MVFEEVGTDEDFDRITEVRQGEEGPVFATMRCEFDDADNPTYGALVQRKNVAADAPDRLRRHHRLPGRARWPAGSSPAGTRSPTG